MHALRAKVDERVGLTPPLERFPSPTRRPWLMAAASFALVIVIAAIVAALREQPEVVSAPPARKPWQPPGNRDNRSARLGRCSDDGSRRQHHLGHDRTGK